MDAVLKACHGMSWHVMACHGIEVRTTWKSGATPVPQATKPSWSHLPGRKGDPAKWLNSAFGELRHTIQQCPATQAKRLLQTNYRLTVMTNTKQFQHSPSFYILLHLSTPQWFARLNCNQLNSLQVPGLTFLRCWHVKANFHWWCHLWPF